MRFTAIISLGTFLSLPFTCLSSSPSPSPTLARTGPLAIVEIRQTLYTYATACDTKEYSQLSEVFAPNARGDFAVFPTAYGLQNIKNGLLKILKGLVTQHSITTQVISIKNDTDASAVSYLQLNIFGQKNLTGQVYTYYGKFEDDLTFLDNVGWRISNRTLVTIGEIGNRHIL